MTTRHTAHKLATAAAVRITAAGITAHPATNIVNALGHLHDGELVALVTPPRLEFVSWDHTQATWTLHLITGPLAPDQADAAWDTLDAARVALHTGPNPLALDTAEPNAFRDAQGNEWPALTITLTHQH